MTSDGNPYGPERFKELVKERYLISKHTHTSYIDAGDITPIEKDYIIGFIVEDLEMRQKALEQSIMNN